MINFVLNVAWKNLLTDLKRTGPLHSENENFTLSENPG